MIDRQILEILVCPLTHGELILSKDGKELLSPAANCAFPIKDRVPVLLEEESRPLTFEEKEATKAKS